MKFKYKNIIYPIYLTVNPFLSPIKRLIFKFSSRRPFSIGYTPFKWQLIKESIYSKEVLSDFRQNQIKKNFGIKFDERIVEYPWLFSQISNKKEFMLDAGSTFNFKVLLEHPTIQNKKLHIYTFYPENPSFPSKMVSYEYGDLRNLPYENGKFGLIVCHSTIEHIDMDNSMYGYELQFNKDSQTKSYEYLKVISELIRVTQKTGTILMTFPYGRFENHGFFQQFDKPMVDKMLEILKNYGKIELKYIIYEMTGWRFAANSECNDAISHNPHSGAGKGVDGAAHSRCVCCLKFEKQFE